LEYLVDPLGVDVKLPRFFWTPRFEGRGQKQTAFQILMSAMPACAQGDIWDSGKTVSPEFTQVVYGGPALQSGKSYYWKVRPGIRTAKPARGASRPASTWGF